MPNILKTSVFVLRSISSGRNKPNHIIPFRMCWHFDCFLKVWFHLNVIVVLVFVIVVVVDPSTRFQFSGCFYRFLLLRINIYVYWEKAHTHFYKLAFYFDVIHEFSMHYTIRVNLFTAPDISLFLHIVRADTNENEYSTKYEKVTW